MIWHIEPTNDLKEHTHKACECCPKINVLDNGDLQIVHNSYDGREIAERLMEEMNLPLTIKSTWRIEK